MTRGWFVAALKGPRNIEIERKNLAMATKLFDQKYHLVCEKHL